MLEAVLTLLAAAWGAAIHQLVPADQQLAVGVLAFITSSGGVPLPAQNQRAKRHRPRRRRGQSREKALPYL